MIWSGNTWIVTRGFIIGQKQLRMGRMASWRNCWIWLNLQLRNLKHYLYHVPLFLDISTIFRETTLLFIGSHLYFYPYFFIICTPVPSILVWQRGGLVKSFLSYHLSRFSFYCKFLFLGFFLTVFIFLDNCNNHTVKSYEMLFKMVSRSNSYYIHRYKYD